jgi:hypothetical protein
MINLFRIGSRIAKQKRITNLFIEISLFWMLKEHAVKEHLITLSLIIKEENMKQHFRTCLE